MIVVCAGVTKKQLDEVMLTLDKNGDGEIKFDEFAEWYKPHTQTTSATTSGI